MGAGRVQSSRKPPHLGHCKLWPKETAIGLIQDGSRLVFTWWPFRERVWDCTAGEGHPCPPPRRRAMLASPTLICPARLRAQGPVDWRTELGQVD